jgi:uncharacterized damage-inducible protein DinB
MAGVQELMERIRQQRSETVRALAGLGESELTTGVDGGGDVRYCLWRILIETNLARVDVAEALAALGWHQSNAQRILALTFGSRGDLVSRLAGMPDEYLDMEPAPGEWSVRQTLEHANLVDRRYADASLEAVSLARQGLPMRQPSGGGPRGEPERLPGRLIDVLAALRARRDEVVARLAGLTDEELHAPIIYRGEEVDVRFRLHLLAAHEREHTGQVARTLRAVGFAQTEAQMILGQAESARGALFGSLVGVPDDLLTRAPTGDALSVEGILERTIGAEARLVERARDSVAA